MDLIQQGYGSSSSDGEESRKPAKIAKTSSSVQVNGAPDVSLEVIMLKISIRYPVSFNMHSQERSIRSHCPLSLPLARILHRTQTMLAIFIPTQQTRHLPSTSTMIQCCNLFMDPSTLLPPRRCKSERTSGQDTLKRI